MMFFESKIASTFKPDKITENYVIKIFYYMKFILFHEGSGGQK